MTRGATCIAVTFHGIRAEPARSAPDVAVARYVNSAEQLDRVLRAIPIERCCTAGEFTSREAGDWRVLTFDDGLASDYEIAFPALAARGLRATFFVSAENVGRKDYVGGRQLQEMAAAGMEIASHGLSHEYLVTMSRQHALRQILDSKSALEHRLGAEVASFAPVGGHFRRWMPAAASDGGYRVFATMIPGRTRNAATPCLLRRNHIQSVHGASYLSRLLDADPWILRANRARHALLQLPKVLLGLRQYDRLKRQILRASRQPMRRRA